MTPSLPLPVELVINSAQLNVAIQGMIGLSAIALDTESNSRHHYPEQLCLIQIATCNKVQVIDAISLKELEPLRKVLADDSIMKVVHGADYDIRCLDRHYGFRISNLYDTYIAARFAGKMVAVAGGGDSGVTEALFMSGFVSKIIIVEIMPQMLATKMLQERVLSNPKIEVRCGVKIDAIRGSDNLEFLELDDVKTGQKSTLKVDGLLVRVGLIPNTAFLKGTLPLNPIGQVMVNDRMETRIPGIYAVGDVRHNSPMQIVTAVSDGATAAMCSLKYLGVC